MKPVYKDLKWWIALVALIAGFLLESGAVVETSWIYTAIAFIVSLASGGKAIADRKAEAKAIAEKSK